MSALYRKRPIPVEARQIGPSSDGQAGLDLAVWCGGSVSGTYDEPLILVPTLEGDLKARVGDWIVKGPRGEFWPVKGAIFAEDYEVIDDATTALDGQAYDGELAMLRHLVRTLRIAARNNEWLAIQQALINHASDDAEAREKSSRPTADATPDFFEPGRTYTEPDGSTDWQFRCDTVTTHPGTGERTALGWRPLHGEWEPVTYGEDDFEIHQIADAITTQGDSK